MGKWRRAVRAMEQLTAEYGARRTLPQRDIHKTLLLNGLVALKKLHPETEDFYLPMVTQMLHTVKEPDTKGDYQNGAGMHYYCAVKRSGKAMKPVNNCFANGKGKYRSARTMLEESYTMALSLYCAGHCKESAGFLGRAVHMISDICCPPHSSGMTYFSAGASIHKAYELLAEAVYPEFMPEYDEEASAKLQDIFHERSSFDEAVNGIAGSTAAELTMMLDDPFTEVTGRLRYTENIIAALLLRFYRDTVLEPSEAHYIADGSEVRILPDAAKLSVRVSPEGIMLHGVNPSFDSELTVTKMVFYAAHRRDGLFTLSPEKDPEGRVLEVCGKKLKLKQYDPIHGEQLFRL
ncbi:MAG: hypothetical protein J5501_10710 [Ruminococcus sp.]|nr:hypothetical protein [Ruminococcus sp.]